MPKHVPAHALQRGLSTLTVLLASAIGALAFLFPLLAPLWAGAEPLSAPLLTLVVGLCFVALLLEVQGDAVHTKFAALLGVLVALNAVLRFAEVAIPGPGGFSPIFFLILTTGYVYGGRFGFLMGALTLLVSALITGGVGPWLPYQMLAAGWVGLSAPALRPPARWLRGEGRRREVLLLAAASAAWGFAFGALMTLSSWAYVAGPEAAGATTPGAVLRRFLAFYLATSAIWDLARALGNAALTLAFGAATLKVLRRFRRRFAFSYAPEPLPPEGAAP